jgi:hypothetical protein
MPSTEYRLPGRHPASSCALGQPQERLVQTFRQRRQPEAPCRMQACASALSRIPLIMYSACQSLRRMESIGEKKHAIRPGAGHHVEMMQRMMPVIHVHRPLRKYSRKIHSGADSEGEIYALPFVVARIGRRASYGGVRDPLIASREFQ